MRIDILTLDVPTPRGRIFRAECISETIKKLEGKKLLGELGLSNSLEIIQTLGINLTKVSHEIIDLQIEDGKLTGELKILDTPCGSVLSSLIKSGVKIKFDPRGSGSVDFDGLVHDYEILSIEADV